MRASFSLRARLTVWYTVALLIVMALGGAVVLWQQGRIGLARVDRQLRSTCNRKLTSWLSSGIVSRSFAIWRHAWSTVVWSRPPKLLPISGKESWVSSLASAIATCRGLAMARERFFECMSEMRIL